MSKVERRHKHSSSLIIAPLRQISPTFESLSVWSLPILNPHVFWN
jgi:hypothetical protein